MTIIDEIVKEIESLNTTQGVETMREQLMRAQTALSSLSFYKNAPEQLFDEMANLNGIIEKTKATNPDHKSIETFEKIASSMKYAALYIIQIMEIQRKFNLLSSENDMYKNMYNVAISELQQYKAIETAFIEGDLLKKVKAVKEKLNR
jgi:hypothetical protein